MRTTLVFAAFLLTSLAHAQGLRAVRSIPGYVCMQLNVSDAALVSPQTEVPIYDQPSATGRKVALAANTMIVEDQPTVSGFRRVLRFNGETGWMDARFLRPWVDKFSPGTQCVPSIMSNGKPGFGSSR